MLTPQSYITYLSIKWAIIQREKLLSLGSEHILIFMTSLVSSLFCDENVTVSVPIVYTDFFQEWVYNGGKWWTWMLAGLLDLGSPIFYWSVRNRAAWQEVRRGASQRNFICIYTCSSLLTSGVTVSQTPGRWETVPRMGLSSCRRTRSRLPLVLHYGELYNYFLIYQCNNNRNKVYYKHNEPESFPNHPSLPPIHGETVFHETHPWCQKGWGPLC